VNTVSARRRNTIFVSAGLAVAAVIGSVSVLTNSRAVDTNTHVVAYCTLEPIYIIGVDDYDVQTPEIVHPC